MQDFKERLYNYKAEPPAEIWDNINAELDSHSQKVLSIPGLRKRSKFIFYGLTAAASLIIIFLSSVLFNKQEKNQQVKPSVSITELHLDNVVSKKVNDSNNKILEEIIKSSKDKNLLVQQYENPKVKKYIIIAGPEGQPVKISPKVATLIVSADNEYPPKPVWNKKIDKWKQIMLSSTLSPFTTNLLDIVQLSSSINANE
jgi:hypothetical protein